MLELIEACETRAAMLAQHVANWCAQYEPRAIVSRDECSVTVNLRGNNMLSASEVIDDLIADGVVDPTKTDYTVHS